MAQPIVIKALITIGCAILFLFVLILNYKHVRTAGFRGAEKSCQNSISTFFL